MVHKYRSSTEFVTEYMKAYREGINQGQLANRLGVVPSSVSNNKNRLLSMGVKLPKLSSSFVRVSIDIDGLNRIIADELAKDTSSHGSDQ